MSIVANGARGARICVDLGTCPAKVEAGKVLIRIG
jgi:hypothetical protein